MVRVECGYDREVTLAQFSAMLRQRPGLVCALEASGYFNHPSDESIDRKDSIDQKEEVKGSDIEKKRKIK